MGKELTAKLHIYDVNEYGMMVDKLGTKFYVVANVDGTWGVDFYAPRVDTCSPEYNAMFVACKRYKLEYDYFKEDGGSQIWITGELYSVLHLLSLNCVQVEWSQYYEE